MAKGLAVILVVDDDDAVQQTTVDAVDLLGYTAIAASDGPEALRLLREERVDLLLSDIVMPHGMSGVELARAAQAMHPDLPILLVSGFPGRAPSAALDGFTFLSKPYTFGQLREALERLIPAGRQEH
jgi:CheY-like chemotaxis protein